MAACKAYETVVYGKCTLLELRLSILTSARNRHVTRLVLLPSRLNLDNMPCSTVFLLQQLA